MFKAIIVSTNVSSYPNKSVSEKIDDNSAGLAEADGNALLGCELSQSTQCSMLSGNGYQFSSLNL